MKYKEASKRALENKDIQEILKKLLMIYGDADYTKELFETLLSRAYQEGILDTLNKR